MWTSYTVYYNEKGIQCAIAIEIKSVDFNGVAFVQIESIGFHKNACMY